MALGDLFKSKKERDKEDSRKRRKAFRDAEKAVDVVRDRIIKLKTENPLGGVPIPFGQIDLVVAPGLGFDRGGNRLGRGGSFYDRFFANKEVVASRCGLVFAEQVVDSIPTTESDEPVHFLVTDEEVIYCNGQKGA